MSFPIIPPLLWNGITLVSDFGCESEKTEQNPILKIISTFLSVPSHGILNFLKLAMCFVCHWDLTQCSITAFVRLIEVQYTSFQLIHP